MNDLEREKLFLEDKAANCVQPLKNYKNSVRTTLQFLENPYVLWDTGVLANQRAVLKLVFADNLAWARNKGLRTIETSFPFKMLGDFSELKKLKNKMVQLNGDLSNQFFDKMAEWNAILEDTSVNEFPEPT